MFGQTGAPLKCPAWHPSQGALIYSPAEPSPFFAPASQRRRPAERDRINPPRPNLTDPGPLRSRRASGKTAHLRPGLQSAIITLPPLIALSLLTLAASSLSLSLSISHRALVHFSLPPSAQSPTRQVSVIKVSADRRVFISTPSARLVPPSERGMRARQKKIGIGCEREGKKEGGRREGDLDSFRNHL